MENKKKQFGGFLPLELNPGTEYFAKYAPKLGRFNSVKAALSKVLQAIGRKKLYLPYYYCPSTTEAVKQMVEEVVFYHIDEKLLPQDLPDEEDTVIVLVDYFGVLGEKLSLLAASYQKAELIIDRAHNFFGPVEDRDRYHYLFSAKKFFGIPDGAYLVSRYAREEEITQKSSSYSQFLLLSYEEGTNAAYTMKKESDEKIAGHYAGMSILAKGLLENVDYERVKSRRLRNFEFYRNELQDLNQLDLDQDSPAYVFPLLLKEKGSKMKAELVKRSIFVPTLWRGEDLLKAGSQFELSLSEHGIFLPLDQRYDEEDIRYIIAQIREIL